MVPYNQATRPEHLEVKSEQEATADKNSPYICAVKWEKLQGLSDVDVPANALTLLGNRGLRLTALLKNNTYETGGWPRDFIKALKKTKNTKFSSHRKISLIAYTAKIVDRILRSKIEGKFEAELRDQFELTKEK